MGSSSPQGSDRSRGPIAPGAGETDPPPAEASCVCGHAYAEHDFDRVFGGSDGGMECRAGWPEDEPGCDCPKWRRPD